MIGEFKNRKKFTVSPQSIQFESQGKIHKFIVKNICLRTQSYEVISPNQEHYNVESSRKFSLAPGMSKTCFVRHAKCQICHMDQFNKLRITSSQKETILISLQCPLFIEEQVRFISYGKEIDFGQFNFDLEKLITMPIRNLSQSNLKLTLAVQSESENLFTLDFEESQLILLKDRQTILKGNLNFKRGAQFLIKILIRIISEQNITQVAKVQTVLLKGNALVKNQVVKNSNGKAIDLVSLRILNGTSIKGQFQLDNNFRKDCYFKIIPQINSTNPNQFAQKWVQSQIYFSNDVGQVKAFENKKISYQIKTTPNTDDVNFIQKFSKIDFNDEFNFAKMKSSKYSKKNIQINVRVVFIQKQILKNQNIYNFKMRLFIVNPALRISYKPQFNKQIFQVYNQAELRVPFQIPNNSLYKAIPNKGSFESQKTILTFQWKGARPQSGTRPQTRTRPQSGTKVLTSTFCLAYGKCNIFVALPQYDLQIYDYMERENLRPSTSTLKKNLGLHKSNSMMLKRPMSALCSQMVTKKLKLVRTQDFYTQIPKFLAVDRLKNQQLQKLIVSSSQKGNIVSNTWSKQISIHFPHKGHLILKPLKTYLLPYQLQISSFFINDQEFNLFHPSSEYIGKSVSYNNKGNQESYTFSTKQLTFCFNQVKKDYEIQNSTAIKNISRQTFKVFLLTVEDQYFTSGEEDNKIVIHPNQTVNYRIKLCPRNSNHKQSKITRKLQFLVNGQKEQISCYGQLLSVECDFSPKQLRFTQSHYGQEQTSQTLTISNTGLVKLSYRVICPQYIQVSKSQSSGTILGKGVVSIHIKFRPSVYLQNFKDHIKIVIRGSHILYIPILINTKKPDVIVLQNSIDFGQGILGDVLQASITVQNRNRANSQCKISLRQTDLSFNDNSVEKNLVLKQNQRKVLSLKTRVKQIGNIKCKFSQPIAQIPGFGGILSPIYFAYVGKQNVLEITPSSTNHTLVIQDIQSSFKIKLKNLLGQKVELRAQLIPEKNFDETFLLSAQPSVIEIAAYRQKQMSINSLISDLQKLNQEERNYTLLIFRKGHLKPYTTFKFNVKLPTPKLIIEPKELYFPIAGINSWNHMIFRIVNKGYTQIHFKIKKPVNINFQLQVTPRVLSGIQMGPNNQNKLTKLNNQAEVRVSFKSKSTINFQNNIEIEDNMGNIYVVRIFGLVSNCPLLLTENTASQPISARSIPSSISLPLMRTNSFISGENIADQFSQQHEIEHAKFFNFWIGTFMPHMKKQNSFHQYLSKPQTLIEFLEYFTVQIPKTSQKMKLSQIIFEMRKQDIPLDVVNIKSLQKNVLAEWIKFMYIFLSRKYIHPDCLKWLSNVSNQKIDNYEVAYHNYKKIISNVLNALFFRVYRIKISQYEKIVERFDPFLQFLFKIQGKKHLIVSLNILYHKLSNQQYQMIKSEQLNHKIRIFHNSKYERTANWIISDGIPQILSNHGGTNIHTNMSDHGYYFTLDKLNTQAQIMLGLKQKTCLAILNSTLFQKASFIEYDLQEIKPKIHHVLIQCQDKFTQEWNLQYEAPVDSQYKIQFIGDPQFKCRFSNLGLTKMGKKMPINISYSPDNLNPHTGTLTILNKHFSQIFHIKGKALFSQNIQFQKQIKLYQGKKHIQTIQILWEYFCSTTQSSGKKDKIESKKIVRSDKNDKFDNNEKNDKSEKNEKGENSQIPNLTIVEYNQKRNQFISHSLDIIKQSKKQFLVKVKLQYLFEQPVRKLALLYQITNDDHTQSKIFRVIINVVPRPINIQAEIRCKIQQFVTQKIPMQNISDEKQLLLIQFSKSNRQSQKEQRIKKSGPQHSERSQIYSLRSASKSQNQFRLSKTGKIHLESGQLQNINLTYRPDSLFQTSCQIRVTYQESQLVVNYKFRGIPEFPSTYQEQLKVKCLVEQRKTFKLPLKSLVRETTTFEVQTNIRQISGKDKIILGSGQTIQYLFQVFSYHAGLIQGQIMFKSPEVAFVFPVIIIVQQNSKLGKIYRLSSKVRDTTVLQLQLHNKSSENVIYDVICNHESLICPLTFLIQKKCKKTLQVTYFPYIRGQFQAQIKLYNPNLKQIVYRLQMTAQPHQQVIHGPQIQLLQHYLFVLPIKNTTPKDCLIQKPELPSDLSLKTQNTQFPISVLAGKTYRLQLSYKQSQLKSQFDEVVVIRTDCIGEYKFECKLSFNQTKTMDSIYINYQAKKTVTKIDAPLKVNFLNGFNQKLKFHIQYKGSDNQVQNKLVLKSSDKMFLQPYGAVDIEGNIKFNVPAKIEKSLLSIDSTQDLQAPLCLIVLTTKNKIKYQFIYPIKFIRIYQNPQQIVVKANAYEAKKISVNLAIVKEVSRWSIQDLSEEFVKSSFEFTSAHAHQNYLQTIINKPFKYEGFITFYNYKNQAERIALKLQIGQPKYEPIVISSNVGVKSVFQIQLKKGKGPFKVELTNNKTEEFDVQPRQGQFVQTEGQWVAKVNFVYCPNQYSGIKRAKVAITSQQGCYYFNLMGKFKSLRKNQ